MKTNITYQVKKIIYEDLNIEVDVNRFFGKFYNHINQVCYIGGYTNEEYIKWYVIEDDRLRVDIEDLILGGNENLTMNIMKTLNTYKFIEELEEEEFRRRVKRFDF